MTGERLLAVRRFCLDATFTATQVVILAELQIKILRVRPRHLEEHKQGQRTHATILPIKIIPITVELFDSVVNPDVFNGG